MKKLPKGIKKNIRNEKSRINKTVFDVKKKQDLLNKLNEKYYENKGDIQSGNKAGNKS